MACSSNSSLTLVTSSIRNYYDVFVTFRGEDTRHNFTDYLFDALETKGIFAFRDDISLQKGESIGPELLRAIEGSQVFVAVFSRNYASSTWCLQELEKICDCVHVSGKHVLPVFYDVDPSEVRKQSGIYGEAFVKHEQRFQQDSQMVSRWREALKQVGSISGWDLRDKPQSAETKKIVLRIMNILECNSSCVSKDLVRIDSPIKALKNHLLLDSVDGVRAIGICGMGGIGKTTLAMVLYDQISHQFSASCFIDDVSKVFKLHDGPLDAQKQILLQTLGIEHHQICNHYTATNLIRRRLGRERALLILDNVDQVEQLEKIAVDREWLGAGSRIIIISRDEHVLKVYGVDVVYKVPLLNGIESYELFCRKAFKVEKIILSNYQNLAYEILDYAKGLPLAITVLGSFLSGRNVTEWKSALERLRENPNKDVMDVLQLSFDGLEETEKEIFLHIACFFDGGLNPIYEIGWSEKEVKNILNCCGFHADIGLRVLIDKSLISIENTMIIMHSLLKELGRKIVQEQRKWSRVWSKKQLYDVMIENMEKHVEAIVLKATEKIDVNVEHLSKMSNLRLLIIFITEHKSENNMRYVGNFSTESSSCLSNELRYVDWYCYPFKYLPSNFQPNQLVELILKNSSIVQLWENKKHLPNLRKLDLSDSKNLVKIVDFGEFPNLEWLSLKGCENLVELDPSIGLLRKLENLNMFGCSKVFYNSRHLKKSDLIESASYYRSIFSVFRRILPDDPSFSAPTTHTYLLPSLGSLDCLRNIDISFCGLSQIPDSIECLNCLERLSLRGNNFVTLPSLKKLSKLVYLELEHCKLLESLPQLPSPTTVEGDHREKILCQSTGLIIFNCPKLVEREHCCSIMFSWMILFIKANPQACYAEFFTPGSEIPSWINNQSMFGPMPIMHDNNNNIIGFVSCVVFSLAPQDQTTKRYYQLNFYMKRHGKRNRREHRRLIDKHLITTKSSHLWLIYFPLEYYDVYGTMNFRCYGGEELGFEVKSRGYRWVSKQDLQEFNLTMMNHGNSLAHKCKNLEIEYETQSQPQPKSFISLNKE